VKKEPIFVIQKPATDSNGDWLTPPDSGTRVPGCVIWPRAAEEKDGGEVSIDGDNVAAPDNPVIRTLNAEDWVSYRGNVYQVDEPPSRYIGKKILIKTRRARTS
jgi:hypothetical protein